MKTVKQLQSDFRQAQTDIVQKRRRGDFTTKKQGEEYEIAVYDKYLCDVYLTTKDAADLEIMLSYFGTRFTNSYAEARDLFYKGEIEESQRLTLIEKACDAFEKPLVDNQVTTNYSNKKFRWSETIEKSYPVEQGMYENGGEVDVAEVCSNTIHFAVSYFENYLKTYGST